MIKEIDFLDWASKNGYSATEVPMNIMEMILDFEKHVESNVKKLTIPRVVWQSEQLLCPECNSDQIYRHVKGTALHCANCKCNWAE